jgi:hypothetical protein
MNHDEKLKAAIARLCEAEESQRVAGSAAYTASVDHAKAKENTEAKRDELARVIASLGLEDKRIIVGKREYRLVSGEKPFLSVGLFEGRILQEVEPAKCNWDESVYAARKMAREFSSEILNRED